MCFVMNRINQSVTTGIDIITDPKGDSKKLVESLPFKNVAMGNASIGNGFIHCGKMRFFTLEEFDESLVQGYIKLIKTDIGLGVRVVDTYNNESREEEENYIKSGYIKIGYPIKNISKR